MRRFFNWMIQYFWVINILEMFGWKEHTIADDWICDEPGGGGAAGNEITFSFTNKED